MKVGKDRKKKKETKRKLSTFEDQIFKIMEKSLKTALDKSLDEIFKGWK